VEDGVGFPHRLPDGVVLPPEGRRQDLQYGPTHPRTVPGTARHNTQIRIQGFTNHSPGSDSFNDASAPNTHSSTAPNRHVLMTDVESAKNSDGVIAIVSRNSNIKLDKLTTYVLATGDLLPVN
jgi:hypothetical protein